MNQESVILYELYNMGYFLKARIANDEKETHIWEFLQASFSQNPRQAYVSLLGFNTSEMLNKVEILIWSVYF